VHRQLSVAPAVNFLPQTLPKSRPVIMSIPFIPVTR